MLDAKTEAPDAIPVGMAPELTPVFGVPVPPGTPIEFAGALPEAIPAEGKVELSITLRERLWFGGEASESAPSVPSGYFDD